jgi:hypothetical protein
MPANTISSLPLTRVFSTTAPKILPEVSFELSQSNPLLAWMYQQGAVKYGGTGADYRIPVAITDTANVGSHGEFGTFSVTPEDGPDTARWDYATHQGRTRAHFLLSKDEMAKNAKTGAQVVSLLNSKMAIMKEGLGNDIARQMYATTQASNEMYPLGLIVPNTAEASQTTTTAGISRTTYSKWRSRQASISTFNTDGEEKWSEVVLQCSLRGRSRPDIMTTDQDVYLLYDKYVAPSQKDQDLSLGNLGFENLLFRGIPVCFEAELENTGLTYVLTTTGKRRPTNGQFSMKKEHFEVPGKNPMIAGNLKSAVGLHLCVLPDHDFVLEGPYDLGHQMAAMQWNYAFSGFLATGSLSRLGVVSFTGTVE